MMEMVKGGPMDDRPWTIHRKRSWKPDAAVYALAGSERPAAASVVVRLWAQRYKKIALLVMVKRKNYMSDMQQKHETM